MDNQRMRQISNKPAEDAIKMYAKEQSKENLVTLLNALRHSVLLVPGTMNEEKKASPLFMKNQDGKAFLAVFTGKEHFSPENRKQTILALPFPVCNEIVSDKSTFLSGMVLNPYTDHLILKEDLIRKLYEADKEYLDEIRQKQRKQTKAQAEGDILRQLEYQGLPMRLYAEGEEFVRQLCEKKEALVCGMFGEAHQNAGANPYKESDFAVMALGISSDLTLIRIDMPVKAVQTTICHRVYITFDKKTRKCGYYMIEQLPDSKERRLGAVFDHGRYEDLGEAPVEGVELQRIIELAQT